MGCENVTFNEPTNKRSQSLEIHAKTTLRINQERNVCLFTPYANYEEVNDGALLLEQDERSCFAYRESKFPSCSSHDGHVPLVESRKPSERASSLDHVEFVLPHDDGYIHAAPERPNMRKPFWKNLWFWQPNKKSGSCLRATSHHTDRKHGSHFQKQIRTKWEAVGPLHTTCAVGDCARRPIQQHEKRMFD